MPCFSKDDYTHLQYEHVASCKLGLGSTSPTPLSLSPWWTGDWGWMDGYFGSTHVSGDSEWVLKMDRHLQHSCACKLESHNSQATNRAALRREPVSFNPAPLPWDSLPLKALIHPDIQGTDQRLGVEGWSSTRHLCLQVPFPSVAVCCCRTVSVPW